MSSTCRPCLAATVPGITETARHKSFHAFRPWNYLTGCKNVHASKHWNIPGVGFNLLAGCWVLLLWSPVNSKGATNGAAYRGRRLMGWQGATATRVRQQKLQFIWKTPTRHQLYGERPMKPPALRRNVNKPPFLWRKATSNTFITSERDFSNFDQVSRDRGLSHDRFFYLIKLCTFLSAICIKFLELYLSMIRCYRAETLQRK